jgi:hydroxymethylpyrimidine pyrophosphatase-like HAD family hydrolase
VLKLPSCFRSFDQRPEDMLRLVRKLIGQGIVATTPIAVVGVRTSGSYLGPFVAASLRKEGFQDVMALTIRPGQPLKARESAALTDVARRDGLVLLVDDPPTTGGSLDTAAREIGRLGVAPTAIVMLVALLGSEGSLPSKIRRHRHVLLPWDEWSIHDEMTSEQVGAGLDYLLGPRLTVINVERLSRPHPAGERGHVDGRYWVRLSRIEDGVQSWRAVHVASVGLGYFGEHSLAVAKRLKGFVPEHYGLHRGLLYRDWLPDGRRLVPGWAGATPDRFQPFLDYVYARSAALEVDEDTSVRLRGRMPLWEAASNVLSRAFGRGWAWARLPVVDPIVKRILAVDHPAVVDGSMGVGNWFAVGGPTNSLVKIDFDRRAFSNVDLSSYDPVFDVASLAADLEFEAAVGNRPAPRPEMVRNSWVEITGRSITAERWFLLQVVHLWDRQRLEAGREAAFSRALARASQRYFAELFFDGVHPAGRGPYCALDVDGVLETEGFGFSSLSASSALALRALVAHGYRPLLATGRSVAEVRERCSALGLAGGVAEYGSAFYDHDRGAVRSLITGSQLTDLERLRRAIGAIEGILVDDAYQHSVRVYRFGARGERLPPAADLVDGILAELGLRDSVALHRGDAQVDLVAAGVDKGKGLSALLRHLGGDLEADGGRPLALAVGDGPGDIPMFGLARLAAAPAHANALVRRAAGRTMSGPYQAGLADAVALLLGHRPGSCRVCAAPVLEPASRAVMTLLSAQERGGRSMVSSAIRLAMAARHEWRS